MSDIELQFDAIASEYGAIEADPDKSKYELTINWPSLARLLPPPPASILDYGCGSGVYARFLMAQGYDVTASDVAPAMIAQLADFDGEAIIWSYQDSPLQRTFDVVIAKLVLQFIEDMEGFARAMDRTVSDSGRLIVSVPHPDKSRLLAGSDGRYDTQIGTSGLRATMIHRELRQYVTAFESNNFLLASSDAPIDPGAPAEPAKRLTMVFSRAKPAL